MTNEEKAKELAFVGGYTDNFNISRIILQKCCEIAEWKEQQFAEEKKKWLKKMSKWILENINKPFSNGGYISYVPPKGLYEDIEVYCAATRFVEDLKNIMEGE